MIAARLVYFEQALKGRSLIEGEQKRWTGNQLTEAYRLVLLDVARWRREALSDPEEYEKRDRFLLKLESIAIDSMPGRGLIAPQSAGA